MALTPKQCRYIDQHRAKKSVRMLAQELNKTEEEVESYINQSQPTLSSAKQLAFSIIALSIPVLFFIFLEIGLRVGNYKGNTDLFIFPDATGDTLAFPNPEFTKRYFFNTTVVPNPSRDAFLARKPENGFRVFVMGGSSTAGYPYGFNGTFSKVVKDVLTYHFPERHIEIVNVATSAINTYTLYDQVDEILEQSPDMILIYTGHNEYYGALGIGSSESLGAYPGFVRFYLSIQRLKTFMLLRDAYVGVMNIIGSGGKPSGTLMKQVVKEQEILLDSELYHLGLEQFKSNISLITEAFISKDIPVFIGSLASNLKDMPPFISKETSSLPSASEVFSKARELYVQGDTLLAAEQFLYAKELDALRFRAPEKMNEIIRELSSEHSLIHYVPVQETLTRYSTSGIIDNELMLEHLHPTSYGYFLMGKVFSQQILSQPYLSSTVEPETINWDYFFDKTYITELDSLGAYYRIKVLKGSWPFTERTSPLAPKRVAPGNPADSLAYEMSVKDLYWENAKVELADYYVKTKQFDKALREYYGLIREIPYNVSAYNLAARILLDLNRYDEAKPLLLKAHQMEPTAYTSKMLGSIFIDESKYEEGIRLLLESLRLKPNDPQTLYNLSGAFALTKQYSKALEAADKITEINPRFPGLRQWLQQLEPFRK